MSSYKRREGAYIQGIWQVYWCWHFKWVCYEYFLHLSETVCYYTCYSTQARSPPQVLTHQQVRESRTHPWDKYVSLSRASLQSSSQTWYFHAACVYNNSRCVSGAAAALLRGSRLSGESKLWPHRTLNNIHRSARFLRNMREKRWSFNTEGNNRLTDKGRKDWLNLKCLFILSKEYIYIFNLLLDYKYTVIYSHLQAYSNTTVTHQTK